MNGMYVHLISLLMEKRLQMNNFCIILQDDFFPYV